MGSKNPNNPFETRRRSLERELLEVERTLEESEKSRPGRETLGAKVWRMIKARGVQPGPRGRDDRGQGSGGSGLMRIPAEAVRKPSASEPSEPREKRLALAPATVTAGSTLETSLVYGGLYAGLIRPKNQTRNRLALNIGMIVFVVVAFWMFFSQGAQ